MCSWKDTRLSQGCCSWDWHRVVQMGLPYLCHCRVTGRWIPGCLPMPWGPTGLRNVLSPNSGKETPNGFVPLMDPVLSLLRVSPLANVFIGQALTLGIKDTGVLKTRHDPSPFGAYYLGKRQAFSSSSHKGMKGYTPQWVYWRNVCDPTGTYNKGTPARWWHQMFLWVNKA